MFPASTLPHDSAQPSPSLNKRLRQACDACHGAKTKCCGSSPCTRCQRSGSTCVYSQSNRAGRPKGTRNKKSSDNTKADHGRSESNGSSRTSLSKSYSSSSSGSSINAHTNSYPDPRNISVPSNQLNASSYQFPEPSSSSLSSFASGLSSPLTPHLDLRGQHQKCVSSLPFDFNPGHDFPTFSSSIHDPAAVYQHSFPFPMIANDLSVDPMDLCSGFNPDAGAGDMHSCGMQIFPDNFPLSTEADFSAMSPSQILRDSILQSIEQDDIGFSSSSGITSEPLSKTTTNSNSTESKCSTNCNSAGGSPAMLQPWFSNESSGMSASDADGLALAFSPLLAPNSHASLDENRCQCLHRHAKLLAHLQELLKGLSELPVDVVLNGVEQGLKSWDTYLQCRICQQDQHREVLLLSAMSIRAVTRLLQGASRRMFSQSNPHDWMHGHNSKSQQVDFPPKQGDTKFTLGSYEIKGEESLLVLGVVFSRILAKIQIVLASLKKSLPRLCPGDAEMREGDTYTSYLHKLLEGLEASVQVLSANLMEWRL
ncbi:hypothetical protein H2204_012231 [Knufia peltigerae]|uniref:Zn(2)-C6 fungal-type domain-containing protein n=1 Tax=Knufia peltigerae TaxID=1002370 RepID=A0AA39CR69_9EURO|nr:hypothetical protein H2204_012231 [Knufia peltigerae]